MPVLFIVVVLLALSEAFFVVVVVCGKGIDLILQIKEKGRAVDERPHIPTASMT